MLPALAIVLAFLALILGSGLPLAVLLPNLGRDRILWALPLGLAWTITWVQVLSAVVPVPQAVLGWGIATSLAWVVLLWRKGLSGMIVVAGEARDHAPVLTVMVGYALFAAIPALLNGGLVSLMGSPNHDAYCYVSVSRWLIDHGPQVPEVTPDTPGRGYPFIHLSSSMRIGGSFLLAWISILMSQDPAAVFTLVSGCVLALLGPSTYLLLRAFDAPVKIARFGALLVATSAITTYLHTNQNFDNAVGLVLWLAAYAAAARVLLGPDRLGYSLAGGIVASGMIAAYSELVPFFLFASAALVTGAFVSLRKAALPALWGIAGALAVAIALNPPATRLAYHSLLYQFRFISQGLGGGNVGSPFMEPSVALSMSRFLGLSHLFEAGPSPVVFVAGLLFAAAAVWGLVRHAPRRAMWLCLLAALAVPWIQFTFLKPHGYGQQKYLLYVDSLVMAALAAGIGAVVLAWSQVWLRTALLATCAVVVGANVWSSIGLVRFAASLGNRVIDQDYQTLHDLARAVPPGEPILALTNGYFDHLWLGYGLREDIVHLREHAPDYYAKPSGYFNRPIDHRYILVRSGDVVRQDPGLHLGHNGTFTLYDLFRDGSHPALFLTGGFYDPEHDPAGRFQWMQKAGRLRVWMPRSASVRVTGTAAPVPGFDEVRAEIREVAQEIKAGCEIVTRGSTALSCGPLTLGAGWHDLVLDSLTGARRPSVNPQDAREMSLMIRELRVGYSR